MIFRFGVFELDPDRNELRRAGTRIRVQEQPLRILRELIERRGAIVTRDDLRATIWGETFVDFDRALNTAIKKLRDALGDSAESPRYVETIPRHGYRFIAPVEIIAGGEEWSTEPRTRFRITRTRIVVAALIALIPAIAILAWHRRPRTIDAVAVLSFVNLTGSVTNDYVADGVTDTLISDLANLAEIRVISRTSVMQFKDAKTPLRDVASQLSVNGIVEGSLLQFGDRARLEVKLVDAAHDRLLWSEMFERPASELDALQRDVARSIAIQLRSRIAMGARAKEPDAEAHLLTLKGRYWLNEKRNGAIAKQILQQAIGRDPTYAPPYAALAEAELFAPEDSVSPLESFARAKRAAETALALDPDLADAHVSLGLVRMFLTHDVAGAEQSYRRAIELRPNDANAHQRYGQLLAAQGRFAEALAEGKRSTELDPFSTFAIIDYGRTLYFAHRYDEALTQYRRALAIEPRDKLALWFVMYALTAAGRTEDAFAAMIAILHANGFGRYEQAVRETYAKGGFRAVLKTWADSDANDVRNAPFIRTTGIAALYARAGEVDLAFEWLERASRSHTRDFVFVPVEPQFESLRRDPRFADLVKRARATSSSAP